MEQRKVEGSMARCNWLTKTVIKEHGKRVKKMGERYHIRGNMDQNFERGQKISKICLN